MWFSKEEQKNKWGRIPPPSGQSIKRNVDAKTRVVVTTHDVKLDALIKHITFGAFGSGANLANDFWVTSGISGIGFRPQHGGDWRYIGFLEWEAHLEKAAWDLRSIWARAQLDTRRHMAMAIGGITPKSGADPLTQARDRQAELGKAIEGLAALLRDHVNDPEETFQRYLTEHPILLTVYGVATAKPRFRYPIGKKSPNGKSYVEPDFVIRYPADGSYELVELERPDLDFLTRSGEPRSMVSHAAFQIAEWMHFIHNHYNLIEKDYPGISSAPLKRVIISRSRQNLLSGRDLYEYLTYLRELHSDYRFMTYDVLLNDARMAHAGITELLLVPETISE